MAHSKLYEYKEWGRQIAEVQKQTMEHEENENGRGNSIENQ